MVDVSFIYRSNYTIQECINLLTQPPLHFKINWLFSRDYEIASVSQTKLIITFTKGYNLSSHRTMYQAVFYEHNSLTYIAMKFIGEKHGFPFPLVTDYEITKLFEKRINAKLIEG